MSVIHALLHILDEKQGSDLHLKVGAVPMIRVAGRLLKISDVELSQEKLEEIAKEVIGPSRWDSYQQQRDFDTALQIPQMGRYRVSAFFQRGQISLVLRKVKTEVPSIEELLLPPLLKKIALVDSGLIIVSGPTGCGKSSTLAALVDCINQQREAHILTIEDPIEFLHQDKKGRVSQREVGVDTKDFESALRNCLRQDADVIVIGEMRDQTSMMVAMQAAEVGRVVMTTLHTTDAAGIVGRIMDLFPQNYQEQVRVQLASVLRAGICQRLVPTSSQRPPLAPAVEVLVATPLVKKLIRENKLYKLYAAIETGGEFGMRTFNQSLLEMVNNHVITPEQAMDFSLHPEALRLNLQGIFLDESNRILQAD